MTEQAAWRIVVRGVLLVFSLVLLVLLARELQTVIVQLLLAILLAAAVTPTVDRLTQLTLMHSRWSKIGRGVIAATVSLGGAVVLILVSVAVLSTAVPDLAGLADNLPIYAERVRRAIDETLAANPELAARVSGALPSLSDLAVGATGILTQAPRLVSVATGIFSSLLHVVFT